MTHRIAIPGGIRRTLLIVACSLALAACGSDDDGDATMAEPGSGTDDSNMSGGGNNDGAAFAFVSGATSDFQTGQIERFELGETIASTGTSPATLSDIRVATDGTDVYEIGRFNLDRLTRFAPDELTTPLWQYSVNGSETASNPYEIVFASDTKAYIVRYGSPQIWIVDPSATTEANFMTGTIDLGAYDTDGVPNASDAVLVDDKLFVLMERLDGFAPTRKGYVAVIDTATDTEIATGEGQDGLNGILLETSNPTALHYLEATDEIYVVGRGNIFGNDTVTTDAYDGGIETIDPDSYANGLLVDDGTAGANQGFFVDALVVSQDKGYVLTYTDFGVTTLRSFNPMTGLLNDAIVAGLQDVDISVLAQDPDGRLWVGLNDMDAPSFRLLDPSDDTVLVDSVPTMFNPNDIVFIEVPASPVTP